MGRLAWQGPSATTSGSTVRGLWGASFRPSQVGFRRWDRSHRVRRENHAGGLRQGRRLVQGSHRRGGWTIPSKNIPPHRDSAEDISRMCRRYGIGCTPTGTANKVVAVSDFGEGEGGGRELQQKPAGRRDGEGGGSNSVHILRTGSGKLGRGIGDNHMRVPDPCPHGEFVHVSFMLARADHLARRHTDPRSLVACSCEVGRGKAIASPGEACSRPAND